MTKPSKAVHVVLVTTQGVASGMYQYSVQAAVVLDDFLGKIIYKEERKGKQRKLTVIFPLFLYSSIFVQIKHVSTYLICKPCFCY